MSILWHWTKLSVGWNCSRISALKKKKHTNSLKPSVLIHRANGVWACSPCVPVVQHFHCWWPLLLSLHLQQLGFLITVHAKAEKDRLTYFPSLEKMGQYGQVTKSLTRQGTGSQWHSRSPSHPLSCSCGTPVTSVRTRDFQLWWWRCMGDFLDERFMIPFVVTNNLTEDYLPIAEVHTPYGWKKKKDTMDPS